MEYTLDIKIIMTSFSMVYSIFSHIIGIYSFAPCQIYQEKHK